MFGRSKHRTAETQDIASLQASLQGSTEAFEVIVGRYQSLVCAITYSGTGSVERSEELAQETFLRAWKSLDQLQDLAKFRPWLCSIARSTVQNWFRSRKVDVVGKAAPLDSAVERPSDEAGPEEAAMKKEQQAVVAHALAQLPESLREPVILFYREQKSVREVAHQLGLSENAARQRISRGRSMLREQVADIVETTIARTKPGKAFTTGVIAVVAATAARTTTTAAAATGVAAVVTGSSGVSAVLSGLTAKAVALAAGIVIVAGSIVAYRHLTKPEQFPVAGSQLSVVDSQQAHPQPDAGESEASTAISPSDAPAADLDSALRTPHSALPAPPVEQNRARTAATPTQAKPYEFTPKGVLSGVITDIDTGEPVRNARVEISMSWWAEARTDANGFYSFDKVRSPGNYQVSVFSPEYVGIARDDRNPAIHLSHDRQAVKHFQLPRACMVDVWVTDANGAPVDKANVVITSLADDRSRAIGDSTGLPQTDPNGYFLLGGIPPAQTDYLITVWRTRRLPDEQKTRGRFSRSEYDFAPAGLAIRLSDPNVIKQVQITLQQGQEVQGYAEYADGMPARDIGIRAGPVWWHCNYSVLDNEVNPDGTFTLKHITPGTYDIAMYIPRPDFSGGTSRTVAQVQLPPADGEPLMVRLPGRSPQALVSISGRFIFVGEKRPDHVQVSAYSATGESAFADIAHGPDGKLGDTFVLNRLEPGTYRLQFSGSNVEEKTIRDVMAPTEGLEVELVYAAKPRLTGLVVDGKTGEPIRKFRIRARKLQTLRGPHYVQADRWVHLEDEQGQFSVETVGPGVYQIQAVAEGCAPLWSEEINTDRIAPVTIALSAGGTITGMVVTRSGEPIDAARVIPLSLAGGGMPRTKDTFVCEEGAVTTTAGAFTLKNLPPGAETLKVTHSDYVFTTVGDLRVTEGAVTEGIQITLTAGGTVEGYMYDNEGKPQAAQSLYFQDESGYGGTGDREAGRLGVAVTDSNGFYRVEHLPETFCYVTRANEWSSLGVVRRVVVPKDGRTTRLDFGGLPLVSGAAVLDGVPLAKTKLLLGPTDSPHFGVFRCQTMTDEHGAFVFTGVAQGTHAIYYERPEKRGDWLKIATVTVAGTNVDLGVIPGSGIGRLYVTFNASGPGSDWKIERLLLCEDKGIYGTPLRAADAPAEAGKPWVIHNVEPGKYVLLMLRQDGTHWRKPVELAPGQSEWHISLDTLKAGARVTGRLLGDSSQGAALWRDDKEILATILPSQEGTYAVEGLPAGRYCVGDNFTMLYDLPPIAEFELGEGEAKMFDLDLSAKPKREIALLIVQVVGPAGILLNDAHLSLEGPLGAIEPLQSTPQGFMFLSIPGDHTLHIEAPGCKPIRRALTLKATGPADLKSQTLTVRLEKR